MLGISGGFFKLFPFAVNGKYDSKKLATLAAIAVFLRNTLRSTIHSSGLFIILNMKYCFDYKFLMTINKTKHKEIIERRAVKLAIFTE